MSHNDDNRWDPNGDVTREGTVSEQADSETASSADEEGSLKTFSGLGYSEIECFQRETSFPAAVSDSRFGFIIDNDSIGILDADSENLTEIPGYDASSVTDLCFGRGEYLYTVEGGKIIQLLTSAPLGETLDVSEPIVQLGHFSSQPTLVALTETGSVKLVEQSGRVRHTIQQIRQGDAHLVVGDDHVFIADAETLTCHDMDGNLVFKTALRRPATDIAFMNDRVLVAEEGDVLQWFDRDGDQSATGSQAISSLVDIGDEVVFGENDGDIIVCSDGGTVKSVGKSPGEGLIHTPAAEAFVVFGEQTHLLTRDEYPKVKLEDENLTVGAKSLNLTLVNPLPVSYEFVISLENEAGETAEFILSVEERQTLTQSLPLTQYDYASTPGKFSVNTLAPERAPTRTVKVTTASPGTEETVTSPGAENVPNQPDDANGTEPDPNFESKIGPESASETGSTTSPPTREDESRTGQAETKLAEFDQEWSSAREIANTAEESKPGKTKSEETPSPSNERSTATDSSEDSHDDSTNAATSEDSISVPEDPEENDDKPNLASPAERSPREEINTTLKLSRFNDKKAVFTLTVENTVGRDFEVTGFDLPSGYSVRDAPDIVSGSQTTDITIIGPNRPNEEIRAVVLLKDRPTPAAAVTLPDIDLTTRARSNTTADPAVVIRVTNPGPVPIFERLVIEIVSQTYETILHKYVLTPELTVGDNRFIIPADDYDQTQIAVKCEHGFGHSTDEQSSILNSGFSESDQPSAQNTDPEHTNSPETAAINDLKTSRTLGAVAHRSRSRSFDPNLEYYPSERIQVGQRLNPIVDEMKLENNSEHRSPPLKLKTGGSRDNTIDLGRVPAGDTMRVNKAVQELESPTHLAEWSVTTDEGTEVMSVPSSDIPVTNPPIEARARLQHTEDGRIHLSISIKNTTIENAVLTSVVDSYGQFDIDTNVELSIGTTYFTKTLDDFELVFDSNRLFKLQLEASDGTWKTELPTVVDVQGAVEPAPVTLTTEQRSIGGTWIVVTRRDQRIQAIYLQNKDGETSLKQSFNGDTATLLLPEVPPEGRSFYLKFVYDDRSVKVPYFVQIADDDSIHFRRVAGDIPLSEFFTDTWPTRLETKWLNEENSEGDGSAAE